MSNANTATAANANAEVDLRFMDMNYPSLCIPRVFSEVTEKKIRQELDRIDLGKIKRVDMIMCRSERGELYKRVYIHFDRWYWNENAQIIRKNLIEGMDIKIVYSNPWYWKVSANRNDVRRLDIEAERREEYRLRLEEEERERVRRAEEKRLREEKRQLEEQERKLRNAKRIEEEKERLESQRRMEDPDYPDMEMFKIDYGDIKIPKNLRRPLKLKA